MGLISGFIVFIGFRGRIFMHFSHGLGYNAPLFFPMNAGLKTH